MLSGKRMHPAQRLLQSHSSGGPCSLLAAASPQRTSPPEPRRDRSVHSSDSRAHHISSSSRRSRSSRSVAASVRAYE
eukprot:COSAG02_NODE_548_length_20472_cov_5.958524_13_plen_77_part_00